MQLGNKRRDCRTRSGQINYNFFAYPLSNVLPRVVSPLLKPFADFFALVSKTPTTVVLDSLAQADEHGNQPPTVQCPGEISLVPDPAYSFSFWPHDFRSDFDEGTIRRHVDH